MTDVRTQALVSLTAGAPNLLNALTHLVPAMADAQNNVGKTSLFGKDKGAAAYAEFVKHLQTTLLAMHRDRVISTSSPPEEVRTELVAALQMFAAAYPNWRDAYGFADDFFARGLHPRLEAAITEAREWVEYLERPTLTRKPIMPR